MPVELETLNALDRFGAGAVFGGQADARMLRRLSIMETVVKLYHAREQAENWAGWAKDNPEANILLNKAMKAAQ